MSKNYFWNQELTQPFRESNDYKSIIEQVNEYQSQGMKAKNPGFMNY